MCTHEWYVGMGMSTGEGSVHSLMGIAKKILTVWEEFFEGD